MRLDWLKDFVVLAECGNFTEAASRRHTTQASLSRRIQLLEAWSGAPLVDRVSRPQRLTVAGKELLALALTVIEQTDDFRSRYRTTFREANIEVVAPFIISECFFDIMLRAAESLFGGAPLKLSIINQLEIDDYVKKSGCRFSIVHQVREPAQTGKQTPSPYCKTIAKDKLLLVSKLNKRGDPLFDTSNFLDKDPSFVWQGNGSYLGQIGMKRAERVLGQKPSVRYEYLHSPILLGTIRSGAGFGWMPQSLIADHLKTGELVTLGGDDYAIELDVVLRRSRKFASVDERRLWDRIVGSAH